MKSGFLLINKPKDWTSHDVVAYLRKITGIKKVRKASPRTKIGHAGTLDPFATGLLIVGIGREATKRLDEFKAMPKTYEAVLKLGATSDTYDSTGKIKKQFTRNPSTSLRTGNKQITESEVKTVLEKFSGKQRQTPPMFSAKKVKGKKLYEMARKGIKIEREPVEIEIYKIKLINYKWPYLEIKIECSTGTYIRSLAHDIGQELGCGAYCDELKRTRIGKCKLEDAVEPKSLDLNKINKIIHSF